MVTDDRLIRITRRVRAVGIFVLFLLAPFGMPDSAFAGEGECTDYHIEFCITEGLCEQDEGEPCGEAIPGCAGDGTIECRETTWCSPEEGDTSSFCIFGDGGGGDPD